MRIAALCSAGKSLYGIVNALEGNRNNRRSRLVVKVVKEKGDGFAGLIFAAKVPSPFIAAPLAEFR
jgi:hypothetical protein